MNEITSYSLAFLIATAVSFQLTRAVRDWAVRREWVDSPDSHRKRHDRPTPPVGGIAIYLSMLVVIAGWIAMTPSALWTALPILVLGALMMGVGLWDDLRGLSPLQKFALQAAIALLAWFSGFRIIGGWSYAGSGLVLGVMSLPITVMWIVGITNAFNLIDGIDGLAAGTALFSMMSLLVASLVGRADPWTIMVLAALAGATTGFLRYNFNPASIFLGDSGSLLLGLLIALLSIASSQKSTVAFAIAVPLVSLGLPVLDTLVVVIRRFLARKPIFEGDRRHIHHVLVDRGLSIRQAVILLYGVCGVLGLISLTFLNPSGQTLGFALGALGVAVGVGLQQLQIPELRQLKENLSRSFQHQRDLIAAQVGIDRMIASLRAAQTPADLLDGLATGLHETEFDEVELEVPVDRWNAARWLKASPRWREAPAMRLASDRSQLLSLLWRRAENDAPRPRTAQFRIEHSMTVRPGARVETATVRLRADTSSAYPISAVCWWTQSVPAEIEAALRRVLNGGDALDTRRIAR